MYVLLNVEVSLVASAKVGKAVTGRLHVPQYQTLSKAFNVSRTQASWMDQCPIPQELCSRFCICRRLKLGFRISKLERLENCLITYPQTSF